MSNFEPTIDLPENIDEDDAVVPSNAKSRDAKVQKRRKSVLRWIMVGAGLGLLGAGYGSARVLIAVLASYLLFSIGFAIVGSFARPVPEPPPPGELRRVKLIYRCPTCGTELKMTLANDQMPAPPRHCSDEMDLMPANEL